MAVRVPKPRRCLARRERNYKNVMRPTRWGNPYPLDEAQGMTRARSLALYAQWLERKLRADPDFLEPLRGYNLGCTCPPELPCHADVLLRRLYGAPA
jgi:hypothetical protein